MKYHYMSEEEFLSKCPCGYNLKSYIETLTPPESKLVFVLAKISQSDENTYTATYDTFPPDANPAMRLEASCTILSGHKQDFKLTGSRNI